MTKCVVNGVTDNKLRDWERIADEKMNSAWTSIFVCYSLLRGFAKCAKSCDNEGSVQLVGWESLGAGRVEICRDGEWGTICAEADDNSWSEKNAQVACRSLGYSGALNSILHNTITNNMQERNTPTPIHYSQVRCTGEQQSLLDCELSDTTTRCTHQHDAAIVCRLTERDGHVRLVGDLRDEVGAVELYYPQIGWTGICADPDQRQYWLRENQAAQVVCRQLGYLGGTAYVQPLNSTFIAKRSVTIEECNMDEDFDLTQCNTSVLTTNCSTDDLAWVQCALGNGEYGDASKVGSTREGVVQLEFNGRRGHICNTGWDGIDVRVACTEFNLDNSITDYDVNPKGNYSRYISDLMPIWVTGVDCTISEYRNSEDISVKENDIIECGLSSSYPVGFTDCHANYSRSRMAQVDCGTPQDPLLALYIVVGVLSPIIITGLILMSVYLKKKCCKDYSCTDVGYAIGNCCESVRSLVSSCFRCIRRVFTPRMTLHFGNSDNTRTATATTFSSSTDSEVSPGDTFYEAQGDPEPLEDPGFTKPAPPTYSEANNYTTVQDNVAPPSAADSPAY